MSKSFDTNQMIAEKPKRRKSLDFATLYKTDEETSAILAERGKRRDSAGAEAISSSKNKEETPKQKCSSKKRNKNKNTSLNISHIEGQNLNVSNNEKITSTPYAKETSKPNRALSVKSIIKNSSACNTTMETIDTPRSKKRNKSVSFMVDDNEVTAVKKIKSNENSPSETSINKMKSKSPKKDKYRKKKDVGKENNETNAQENEEDIKTPKPNKTLKVTKVDNDTESNFAPNDSMENNVEAKKKFRKYKKHNRSVNTDNTENDNIENRNETKRKQLKKKNRHLKQADNAETVHPVETNTELQSFALEKDSNNNKSKERKAKKQKQHHKQSENMETEFTNVEPQQKSHKKDSEPATEVIAENLENLNIGDNAHTLTNLLDEMSVVEKNKKRKTKNKLKTGKDKNDKTPSSASIETTDLEKTDEGKEKVVWKKRKWNKDKKVETDSLLTSVIVENLPLKIIFDFRKVLIEYFSKLGLVKNIGVAEVYPNEEPKPVFTTTVHFHSEEAATKALEEDNSRFESSRLRIKRCLPPTESTLVVRSYGELSEQALSSMFLGAGRVRSIRHAIKGRKSMGTAFVELDGPESVERGIALAQDAKIGGKKIHVAKFELRHAKKPRSTELGSGD